MELEVMDDSDYKIELQWNIELFFSWIPSN